jgi:hypothetical protein
MESKPVCKSVCWYLVSWYNEIDETTEGALKETYNFDGLVTFKASGVEIAMFYVSMGFIILFGISALCKFQPKLLVFLIPFLIWMFLRSSRKDMAATAHWVAGFLGAIGGAALVLLSLFLKAKIG